VAKVYGFNILEERGKPIVSFGFKAQSDAAAAAALTARIVENLHL
jgi:hypothetical protein